MYNLYSFLKKYCKKKCEECYTTDIFKQYGALFIYVLKVLFFQKALMALWALYFQFREIKYLSFCQNRSMSSVIT